MNQKKKIMGNLRVPTLRAEHTTPEQKLIYLLEYYYNKERHSNLRELLNEVDLTMGLVYKIYKDKKQPTQQEAWKIKNAISYLTVVTGWSQFASQKDIIDRPTQEKNEIIKQEHRYIQKHKTKCVMGVPISKMQFNEETKLYWVKPGHTRVTEHQIYRALRSKEYEMKLTKASKLGSLTNEPWEC